VENPDGSTTVTETAEDGTVTETTTSPNGVVVVTVTDPSGTVSQITGTIPADVAGQAAQDGTTVTLPVTVTPEKLAQDAPPISLDIQGEAGEIAVEIPVSNVDLGIVAMVAQEDGSLEIDKASLVTDTGVVVQASGGDVIKIVDNTKTFSDVPEGYWAEDAITFVTARTVFNGDDDGAFQPTVPMTRGMMAQVLYNLENNPEATLEANFPDVHDAAWYADAVDWAAEVGVVEGYGSGLFGPDDSITREMLIVMLWRYLGSPNATQTTLSFPDAADVSDWAHAAMLWATEVGLISGKDDGTLDPQGLASRAEVAQVFMNYLTKL
jgi:hypothetical protein